MAIKFLLRGTAGQSYDPRVLANQPEAGESTYRWLTDDDFSWAWNWKVEDGAATVAMASFDPGEGTSTANGWTHGGFNRYSDGLHAVYNVVAENRSGSDSTKIDYSSLTFRIDPGDAELPSLGRLAYIGAARGTTDGLYSTLQANAAFMRILPADGYEGELVAAGASSNSTAYYLAEVDTVNKSAGLRNKMSNMGSAVNNATLGISLVFEDGASGGPGGWFGGLGPPLVRLGSPGYRGSWRRRRRRR